jgi:cell division septal protein FtsQ
MSGASTPAGRRRAAARTAKPAPRKPAKPRAAARPAKPAAQGRKRKPAAASRARRSPAPRRPRQVAVAGPSLAERLPNLPRISMPSLPSLRVPRPSLAGLREMRIRRMLVIALVSFAALFAFYFGWFRDSSLVAVKHVTVNGVTTPDSDQVVTALTDAAKGMSTLNVDQAKLSAAASSFPTVESISADASFPSGMTIDVSERPPALIASDGRDETPVAADGTILTGLTLPKDDASKLPVLKVDQVRESGRLAGTPLEKALVIGAAPAPLRPLIAGEKVEPGTGVVVTMDGGFRIEFGSSELPGRKWAAAAAVLADRGLHSLTYVDVRIPTRPAVGGS